MKIDRKFTEAGKDVFESVERTRCASRISSLGGSVVFEMNDAEVPADGSPFATGIMASQYFHSIKNLTLVVIASIAIAAGGCATQTQTHSDPVAEGMIPGDSSLVASVNNAQDGFVFIAPESGTIYYFANSNLIATIQVSEGEQVEYNNWSGVGTLSSVLKVEGKDVYSKGFRAERNQLYFSSEKR